MAKANFPGRSSNKESSEIINITSARSQSESKIFAKKKTQQNLIIQIIGIFWRYNSHYKSEFRRHSQTTNKSSRKINFRREKKSNQRCFSVGKSWIIGVNVHAEKSKLSASFFEFFCVLLIFPLFCKSQIVWQKKSEKNKFARFLFWLETVERWIALFPGSFSVKIEDLEIFSTSRIFSSSRLNLTPMCSDFTASFQTHLQIKTPRGRIHLRFALLV